MARECSVYYDRARHIITTDPLFESFPPDEQQLPNPLVVDDVHLTWIVAERSGHLLHILQNRSVRVSR